MTYTPTNWIDGSTPLNRTNMMKIENELAALDPLAPGAPSATPPGSPVDGQFWLLPADAANGVNWLFRYNAGSASAYKWEFAGGPEAVVLGGALDTTTTAYPTFVLGTHTPVFTLPRAGDYIVELTCEGNNNVAGQGLMICPSAIGVANVDVNITYATSTSAGNVVSLARRSRLNALAASAQMTVYFCAFSSGTATIERVVLCVSPVRVS